MTYFIKLLSPKSIICGFTPDTWMIDNPTFGYKKCCLNVDNYSEWKTVNKNKHGKLLTVKHSVVCTKCNSVIMGCNVFKSNKQLSFENWKRIVLLTP